MGKWRADGMAMHGMQIQAARRVEFTHVVEALTRAMKGSTAAIDQ